MQLKRVAYNHCGQRILHKRGNDAQGKETVRQNCVDYKCRRAGSGRPKWQRGRLNRRSSKSKEITPSDDSADIFRQNTQSGLCCEEKPSVPLPPTMMKEYWNIRRRHCHITTKRKRILQLAEPKKRSSSSSTPLPCALSIARKVNIVSAEKPVFSRTEQLAQPKVSRLISLKSDRCYSNFSLERKLNINRNLRKTLLSLYSRLSNARPPEPQRQRKVWSEQERRKREMFFRRLANLDNVSKTDLKCPGAKIETKKVSKPVELRRYRTLAKPKKYEEHQRQDWHLTPHLRNYTPSPRILRLSKAKSPPEVKRYNPFQVKKSAIQYVVSDRIIKLAIPIIRYDLKRYRDTNPSIPTRKALSAKPSPRVVTLAAPKDSFGVATKNHPFEVKRRALHARLSSRIKELAVPRKRSSL